MDTGQKNGKEEDRKTLTHTHTHTHTQTHTLKSHDRPEGPRTLYVKLCSLTV